jgi:hypothetical protein
MKGLNVRLGSYKYDEAAWNRSKYGGQYWATCNKALFQMITSTECI